MSVQARNADVEALHRMGYAQELRRRMSTFSNFAVSFTIISILSGCLTLYYFGFFLVVLPLLGLLETTKPLPNSISEAVLSAPPGAKA